MGYFPVRYVDCLEGNGEWYGCPQVHTALLGMVCLWHRLKTHRNGDMFCTYGSYRKSDGIVWTVQWNNPMGSCEWIYGWYVKKILVKWSPATIQVSCHYIQNARKQYDTMFLCTSKCYGFPIAGSNLICTKYLKAIGISDAKHRFPNSWCH